VARSRSGRENKLVQELSTKVARHWRDPKEVGRELNL